MGLKNNRMRNFNLRGTTAAVANQPLLDKPVNPWNSSHVFPRGFKQEGVYFSSLDREGCQFATDEATFRATGATTNVVSLPIDITHTIVAYSYNSKCYARVSIRIGLTYSWGTEILVNNAATDSISLCKVSNTSFAIAYCDDGGDDYLCVRVGTFDSDGTVTLGTEKVLVSGALYKTYGTSICMPKDGVLAVAHMLNADKHLDVIAATFSGTTIDDPGSAVEFENGATKYPSICSYMDGEIIVVYQDDGASNDPITYRTGKVYVNALVETYGSATSMAGATAAASSIKVIKAIDKTVIIGWIDSTYGHVRAATIAAGVLTLGTELQLTSSATLTFDIAFLNSDKFIAAYEDDGDSDYGKVKIFTRSTTTLTAGQEDVFALSGTAYTSIAAYEDSVFLVAFQDDAHASDIGNAILGKIRDHIIDIRSEAASVQYNGWVYSLEQAGVGKMAIYLLTGTTNASANTAMSTQKTLPWNKHAGLFVWFKDKGMYLEDDGTVAPYASGVSKANRTIDIRSTATSQAFTCYAVKWNSKIQYIAHS